MRNRIFLYGLIFFMAFHHTTQAADSLGKWIPLQARLLTVDDLGNIYVVKKDNQLLRFNSQGDSTGFYKSIYNGAIESIDATNPLNILLFYPDLKKIQVLDRMLASRFELNLAAINIFGAQAAAMSVDGSIWIFDRFNAQLLKLNNALNNQTEPVDLRQVLPQVPDAHYMIEQNRMLFITDTAKGVFVFDQFGDFLKHLPILQVQQLQFKSDQLFFLQDGQWASYNWKSFREQHSPMPFYNGQKPIRAQLAGDRLWLLYENGLGVFKLLEGR